MNQQEFTTIILDSPILSTKKKNEILSHVDALTPYQIADILAMLYALELSIYKRSKNIEK